MQEAVESEKVREVLGALMLVADPGIVMRKLQAFLKILGVRYLVDPENRRIIVPMLVEGRQHTIVISLQGAWVITKAKITDTKDLPEDLKLALFKELLRANASIPECAYGVEEDGSVVVTESVLITALDFEGFAEEFLALASAIGHFWRNIWPPIEQKLAELKEKESRIAYT